MAEQRWHLPEGTHPLLQRVHRQKTVRQPQDLTLPELHLWVGRDLQSSGATITVWEPTGGVHPTYRYLWAPRRGTQKLTTNGTQHAATEPPTGIDRATARLL